MKALTAMAFSGLVGLSTWGLYHGLQPATAKPTPAELPPTSPETLGTIQVSVESQRAIGLQCAPAQLVDASEGVVAAGEVVVPPGSDIVLSAPTAGRVEGKPLALPRAGERVRVGQQLLALVPMATIDRGAKAAADRDLEAARANATLSAARLDRSMAMQKAGSASQRNVEDARAQHLVAQAEERAAQSRRRTLEGGVLDADVALAVKSPVDGVVRAVRVAAGQAVPSGAPMIDLLGTGRWVRASLTVGDAYTVDDQGDTRARRVGGKDALPLELVLAPPSADPVRGTIDRFFALPPDSDWIPGERVLVDLATQTTRQVLVVPATAVIRDAEGAAWVYEQLSRDTFRRRRVEVIRRVDDRMIVARGLGPESRIATIGASELWGFELGADR
jgi:membrane fusion protein, heavy metal efflux system